MIRFPWYNILSRMVVVSFLWGASAGAQIANGSFEFGLDGWNVLGYVSLVGPPNRVPVGTDGSHALALGSFDVSSSSISQRLTLQPATQYRLTFDWYAWGDLVAGRTGIVSVVITNDAGTVLARQSFTNITGSFMPDGASGFISTSVLFTTAAGATDAVLSFLDASPNGGMGVDPIIDNVRMSAESGGLPELDLLRIYPDSTVFTNSIYVLMATTNEFGIIHYTLDNSIPASSSPVYSKPVRLTNTTVVSARLFFDAFPISDVASATFTAGSAPPEVQFIPDAPLFTNSVNVELKARIGFGTVRFTVDGTEPGLASAAYSTPIKLDKLTTVKAQVFLQSEPISDVASLTFARVYALNDGIPASWREHFFGPGYLIDPRVAADADPDGDGATNWQEYLAGTDPTDPHSVLKAKIKAIPIISWDSISNKVYRVVRKDSVISSNWVTILDNFRATNSVSRFIDTEVADPASFYSVEPVP
jgi:hypothetical protein